MAADERSLRTAAALREAGADFALLTTGDGVCYATGYAPFAGVGPSPFDGGPSAALVAADGRALLVVSNLEEDDARASRAGGVRSYDGFGPGAYPAPLQRLYLDALAVAAREIGLGGTVAVESGNLPAAVAAWLLSAGVAMVDITAALDRARETKTAEEVATLRRCAQIAGVGQTAAGTAARAGRSELEVFGDIRAAMEAAAGGPLAIGVDLLSGPQRTAAVMGPPGPRVMRDGDPVICDLVPQVDGYWGDSCTTLVVGRPAPEFEPLRAAAARALELAGELLAPGTTAGAVAERVRAVIESSGYEDPIHIGHGIGTRNHEAPRLVAGEPTILAPGMVVMVEPGAYVPDVGGSRLELMFHITESGNELLSARTEVTAT